MATLTHLVTTPDTGNTPNTSGSFAPAVGDLLVVFVTKEASALSSPMASADLTSSVAPTAFTLIRNQGHQASAAHIGVFVADALTTDTTSRTVTIANGSDAGAGTIISVYKLVGMARVGSDAVRQSSGQTDQAAGTPAPVFGSAALTANLCIGAIYNATNPAGLTQPSGWTESQDTGYTTGQVSGLQTSFRNSGETGTTITWGSGSASAFASIIVEFDVTSPMSGTAAMAFGAGSSTLTGSGALAGTTDMVFAAGSSTLSGSGALAGTAAMAFTVTGDCADLPAGHPVGILTQLMHGGLLPSRRYGSFSGKTQGGALAGTCSLTFGEGSSTLTGAGALAGSADLVFDDGTSTLLGAGALAGTAALVFAAGSSTLTGAGALAGSAAIVFGEGSSTLIGSGALAGTTAVVFDATGTLDLPSGALSGTVSMTFTPTGTLTASGALAGAAAMLLDGSGTLSGAGALAGTSALVFDGTAVWSAEASIAGTAAMVFTVSGLAAEQVPIEHIGLEYTAPANLMHFTADTHLMHFTAKPKSMHYTAEEHDA